MKKYLGAIKGYIVLSIVFSMIEAIFTSIILLFPGWLVDNYQKGMSYIFRLTILYMIAFSIYLLDAYCSNRVADHRRIKFESSIKKDFFNAVASRDFKKFHAYDTAEYISMQSNDITEMCQNYLSPLLSIYRSLLLITAFGISLICFVNYYIAAVIFFFSFIVVFVPKLTADKLAMKNKHYLDQVGQYTSKVKKLLEAHDILDCSGRKKIKELHREELDDVLAANMKFRKINSLAMVINGGSVEFVSVITFIIVAFLLFNGKITVGMATIAFTYSTRFMEPIYELNVCIGKVHSVKKVQEKLLKIINGEEQNETDSAMDIRTICTSKLEKAYAHTAITIPETSFHYPKKYLVTGENGVGKSVFLRMLMQFEEPDNGKIEYDKKAGVNISEDICYVPQDPVIFDSSYEDNVTIFHAYDGAHIDMYESYFPKEIINNIKKNSSPENLSGGEKQVISIIRALCSNKKILLMDEPFSAMNQITIDHFMENIGNIHRMLIIVAHNVGEHLDKFDEEIHISR